MTTQLENGVLILPKAVLDPTTLLEKLKELEWVRHHQVPRSEYYYNLDRKPYTYGTPPYDRTYVSQPWEPLCLRLLHCVAEQVAHTTYDTCFLNRYLNSSDSLQWHSDDSPEMDDEKPIVILSLGAEREIWFREKTDGKCAACNGSGRYDIAGSPACAACNGTGKEPAGEIVKVRLPNGSACIMPPGFQDTHQHRIPKGDRPTDERISLTYRGYV